jgi:CRP-like cAMP-binding protein
MRRDGRRAAMSADSPFIDRVRPFLRKNTFFGGLPDAALEALIRKGHTKKFAKGDTISRRGDPGDSLMVILSGRLKITNITADGREVVLNFISTGEINGEIAALDGRERTADAVALEPGELFVVHARDLLPTLNAYPAALFEIIQILCDRLRSTSAIIEDNTLEMRARMAKGLLRLANQHGRKGPNGIQLNLTLSQRELGAYLSLSRENVSRQLSWLRELKTIDVVGSQIIITDAPTLESIAETRAAPAKA